MNPGCSKWRNFRSLKDDTGCQAGIKAAKLRPLWLKTESGNHQILQPRKMWVSHLLP